MRYESHHRHLISPRPRPRTVITGQPPWSQVLLLIYPVNMFEQDRSDFGCFAADVQHGVRRPLHHPADGDLLHVHRDHLQRLLLQVAQRLWLQLERQAHVQPASRRQLDVSAITTP